MTLLAVVVAGVAGFALTAVASLLPVPVHAKAGQTAVAVVAAGFGVAAAFSAGAPTGSTAVDLILRVALVVAVVYAGRWAPPWLLLATALIAAAASNHSDLQALAFASAGAMVAVLLVRRPWPLAQAIVAGALGMVALHLEWPRASLATSVTAALIVVPILVAGYLGLPRGARRPVRLGLLGVAAVTVVLAGLGLVAALVARPHLQTGVDTARQALAAVRAGDRDQAAARFRDAGTAFDDAGTSVGSVWATPALAVPVVGHQVHALRVVAHTGRDLGKVGADTAQAADTSSVHVVDGAVPVGTLESLRTPLQEALASLNGADIAITRIRSPWLVAPIQDRLAEFVSKIQRARDDASVAAEATAVLPAFLGDNGPRRYFLAMQNPAESRAVGGVIGNYGEIEANHGKLSLTRVGRVGDLNTKGVPPKQRKLFADSDYAARYGGQQPEQYWENVTMSPDFPSVASVIRTLYPQSGGQPIDGALSITPAGLAALLRVIGPVDVPGWPTPLTADNTEEVLEHDQYDAFPDKVERLDFLATATETIWKRLTAVRLPSAKELVAALGPAVRSKDIILSSFHPEEQQLFDRMGASARMDPVQGDYLGVVTQNALGSKLDWYLRRKVDYHVTVNPSTGALHATMQIDLHNKAPSKGLPPYVVNGDNPLTAPAGDNRIYLSVYTPWTLTKATLNGKPRPLQSERELGRTVLSDWLDVLPGADATIEIELTGQLPSARDYRLDVFRQPTIATDSVTTTLVADEGGRVTTADGWTRTSASTVAKTFDSLADATLKATLVRGGPGPAT